MTAKEKMIQTIKDGIKQVHLFGIPFLFFGRIMSGYRTYKKILEQTFDGQDRYFMDYAGSGDTWLCCCLLRQYGRIAPDTVFVAPGGLSAKIASYFEFGKVITATKQDGYNLRMLGRFYHGDLQIQPLLYESEPLRHTGVLRRMQGHRGLHFLDFLRIGLERFLGIPYKDEPLEQLKLAYRDEDVTEVFERLRLPEGKTVLIAPYAGRHNMLDIPMEYYENMAQEFLRQGFAVCTNSSDPKDEPPVPGTIPIFLPCPLMVPFCERAGYFVGVRSGLCDIISAAELRKMIVVYPGDTIELEGLVSMSRFFSLTKMGLCKEVAKVGRLV